MNTKLLIDAVPGEVRAVLVEDGEVAEIHIDRDGHESLVGNIYLGRVEAVEASLQAAFVALPGVAAPGYLSAKHAGALVQAGGPRRIERILNQGQLVLVEVTRDAVGDKGPGLTTLVALPGRLLVYHPYRSGNVLSGAIRDEVQRARLEDAASRAVDGVGEGGFIVRTAAQSADVPALLREARELHFRWETLCKAVDAAREPACLQRDLPPLQRTLRDLVRPGISRIVVDGHALFADARHYLSDSNPDLLEQLEVHATATPLFEAAGAEAAIDSMLETRLDLRGGGWVTIEPVEALTAIDVNSGDATAESSREQTSFTTNLRAVDTIARQLRLRDVGGMVLVDFIHMESPKHRDRVLDALRGALGRDRSPCAVLGWTRMGLCELTRRRSRAALPDFLAGRPDVGRKRRRKSVESAGYDVLRRVRAEAAARPGATLAIAAHPDVIDWLRAAGRPAALAEIAGKPPVLEGDKSLPVDEPQIQARS
ncbi:ribonuclease E/G [Emcibacter sp. SYSU 3D8]|uniref:ribonuclease E/G n=1 Tax=Emcibacter sp. SYSU 3D8 TaxID=3133969 RepID=UPI0031FF31AE